MATTKTTMPTRKPAITTSTPQPAEQVMFGAPLYARRKPKTDRTKTIVMATAGVIAVGAAAAAILLTSGAKDEQVAALDTTASAPAIAPVPAVPLPNDMVIAPPQRVITPAPAAPSRARVARAAPSRMAELPTPSAPSVDGAAADVSATVREPAPVTSVPDPAPTAPADASPAVPEIPSEPPAASAEGGSPS